MMPTVHVPNAYQELSWSKENAQLLVISAKPGIYQMENVHNAMVDTNFLRENVQYHLQHLLLMMTMLMIMRKKNKLKNKFQLKLMMHAQNSIRVEHVLSVPSGQFWRMANVWLSATNAKIGTNRLETVLNAMVGSL